MSGGFLKPEVVVGQEVNNVVAVALENFSRVNHLDADELKVNLQKVKLENWRHLPFPEWTERKNKTHPLFSFLRMHGKLGCFERREVFVTNQCAPAYCEVPTLTRERAFRRR